MAYTRARPDWKGFPDTSTPINEDDLDHIEDGIVEAHVLAEAAQATADSKETTAGAQAKANAAQAAAIQRANHTGTQSADTIVDGATNKVFTAADEAKLGGIASSATANQSDAFLLARGNHTGTQSADTIVDGTTNKAFTAVEKTKLAGIEEGASVGIFVREYDSITGWPARGSLVGVCIWINRVDDTVPALGGSGYLDDVDVILRVRV